MRALRAGERGWREPDPGLDPGDYPAAFSACLGLDGDGLQAHQIQDHGADPAAHVLWPRLSEAIVRSSARENCLLVAIAARERRDLEVVEHDRHDGERTRSVDIGAVF